ncbi:MAG: hypothetical protein COU33_01630 [Candidatus Magasanikbacteria bacterium CG10_big_fil_rev_8_21_14_0_10_43_6]|uniref:Secreted protein n=1 Tax=Candidatus Magasanikbacteria bacterium CG10_big_fil_rev_8_21_14_0_10_43_6 TaxID=1974650 RepID=A0A2M6W1M9_9BACT|nr:MAG: hypothetical protein COU33_01630 [Candidatus Magasanikbacteria bacterium CG10_big_fil_rev_8_21_14_0_10_43_6]
MRARRLALIASFLPPCEIFLLAPLPFSVASASASAFASASASASAFAWASASASACRLARRSCLGVRGLAGCLTASNPCSITEETPSSTSSSASATFWLSFSSGFAAGVEDVEGAFGGVGASTGAAGRAGAGRGCVTTGGAPGLAAWRSSRMIM